MPTKNTKKIVLRITPQLCSFIDQACEINGQNRTAFLREAILEHARAKLGKISTRFWQKAESHREAMAAISPSGEGFKSEQEWEDYCLKHGPQTLDEVNAARKASGQPLLPPSATVESTTRTVGPPPLTL